MPYSPGQVLSAADLNASLAAKATYSYGTAVPVAPEVGQVWMDTTAGTASPTGKVYTGSGWATFSGGWASISDSPTGTYTDADGTWKYFVFTADSTLTVTSAGLVDALIVSGGAGGKASLWNGMGSWSVGMVKLSAAAHTVTVGSGGTGNAATAVLAQGGASQLGPHWSQTSAPGSSEVSGGVTSSITGASATYAASAVDAAPAANTGNGGSENLSREGSSGVVIVRVRA